MPKFCTRQQYARDESAERHGKPRPLHQQRGERDDKKGRGGKDFIRLHDGDEAEKIGQSEMTDDHQPGERSDGDPGVIPAHPGRGAAQESSDRKDRNDGDILKEQDRERPVAIGRRQGPLIAQDLHAKRRG